MEELLILLSAGVVAGFAAGFVLGRKRRMGGRHPADPALARLSDDVRDLREKAAVSQKAVDDLVANTGRITGMLSHTAKRGRYAEMEIERVLQLAGLEKNLHYKTQQTVAAGKRPDFVVYLADDREIVIDSKAPLDALQKAADAATDAEREKHYKDHARAVRKHITELSAKEYWADAKTLEFVVMVVPEYALVPALQTDSSLPEFALEKKIVLATPQILALLLRAVSIMWRQGQMTAAVGEIADLASDLHDRLYKFVEQYEEAGRNMGRTVDAYNRSADAWKRNVEPATDKLARAGAAARRIPAVGEVDNRPLSMRSHEEDRPPAS